MAVLLQTNLVSFRSKYEALWFELPSLHILHGGGGGSGLCNSRCWKKPSVFACLSTFARKINSGSWRSSPRACPSQIWTKSTMVWKEKKSTLLVRAANAPVRAANAPYGELHTSTNSRSSDHERGEHTTKRLWSGRGLGQSRTDLRRPILVNFWKAEVRTLDMCCALNYDREAIIAWAKPSLFQENPGACSPGKFWKSRVSNKHFSMFWSMTLHIYCKKIGLKYIQSFLRSEENDRRMNFLTRTMP